MKTVFSIIFITIATFSFGQQNKYNDWFDFNLKEKPLNVKEITLFSFTNYIKPDSKLFLNNSLKGEFWIDEYHFDSLGIISKEFHKIVVDTLGHWTDYSKMKLIQHADSIILYDPHDNEWKERRFLDNNGHLSRKIVDGFCPDTVIFERDTNGRIIQEYRHYFCIDYGQIVNTTYELNYNGDIKLAKSSSQNISVGNELSDSKGSMFYDYIYDAKMNWIIKLTLIDNEVLSITQREIQY